ncbi:hypothetical protein OHR68_04195 [Spirillospora sp. NBC_00431]
MLPILKARKLKVEYRYEYRASDLPYPGGVPADKVRPAWYVHDGSPGGPGTVILFVGPERLG